MKPKSDISLGDIKTRLRENWDKTQGEPRMKAHEGDQKGGRKKR